MSSFAITKRDFSTTLRARGVEENFYSPSRSRCICDPQDDVHPKSNVLRGVESKPRGRDRTMTDLMQMRLNRIASLCDPHRNDKWKQHAEHSLEGCKGWSFARFPCIFPKCGGSADRSRRGRRLFVRPSQHSGSRCIEAFGHLGVKNARVDENGRR